MKKIALIFSILFLLGGVQNSEAQFIKKLKKRAKKAAEDAVINKTEKKVYDETSKKMDTLLGNKKKKSKTGTNKNDNSTENKKEEGNQKMQSDVEVWRNYKFIPGEKVIFLDNLRFEEVGEFPSQWDLVKGGAEIAKFDDTKVIIGTAEHNNRITPLFKQKNYLSDEFTIEFDIYIGNLDRTHYNSWAYYNIYFNEQNFKKATIPDVKLNLRSNKTDGYAADYQFKIEEVNFGAVNAWHHVAMSYHKGKFKLYIDEKRIINLPKFDIEPDIFAIDMSSHTERRNPIQTKVAIKNIRIAHGGGQLYKRIAADGKYVTNGILFDSGKAIIKPQSMGVINKVYNVLQENADWKFEIIGHSDSDGSDENNITLSKQRAEAVKQALVSRGIGEGRLITLGKGENEPLNTNGTPEEKANNRRVEFILKK